MNFAEIHQDIEKALLRERAVEALERIASSLEKLCGEEEE